MKFTSGSWNIGQTIDGTFWISAPPLPRGREHRTVARVMGSSIPKSEREGNARLISAAPQLLDAALSYLDGDECQIDHEGFCQTHGVSKPCRQQMLRAAVRKARGLDRAQRAEA